MTFPDDYFAPKPPINTNVLSGSAAGMDMNGVHVGDPSPEVMAVAEPMLKWFAFEHLPARLKLVSEPFSDLAYELVKVLERSPERTVALRKLLESKDAAVRAAL